MATKNNNGKNPHSQRIKKSIMKRVRLLYVVFAVLAIAVFAMILLTQYGPNGAPLRNRSDYKCYKTLPVKASRGTIYSHDGHILATDSPSYFITLDFTVLDMSGDEFDRQVRALADSLGKAVPEHSREWFEKRLRDIYDRAQKGGPGSKSQPLMREKVHQYQLDRMKTFPIFEKGQLGGGFIYRQDPERYKPFGTLAARTLGKPGEFGLESSFDDVLTGTNGHNLCVRLVKDIWVPVVDNDNVQAVNGRDIVTTLDVNIQDIAESELRKQLLRHNAICGTAIVMDVETGEIRAVSNLSRYGGSVADDMNYAITLRCEPGSTFKLVPFMALLDEAGYSINTPVDCTSSGVYYYQAVPGGKKYEVRDSHVVGKSTLQGIMEHSSNIGFVKMIDKEYKDNPERFTKYIDSLGLNVAINMQLEGGYKPVFKDPKTKGTRGGWDPLTLMKMSYGYALELTPMHTLMLYNAVANDGVMVMPKLVREVRRDGQAAEVFGTEVLNPKICSDKTLQLVRETLYGVVENGTGRAVKNENYSVAGKTGTAQMVMPNGKYVDDRGGRNYLSSFVGYFPADKPKYSCIVAIKTYNGPGARNAFYGSALAAPAFKAISDRVYALYAGSTTPVETRAPQNAVPPVKGGNAKEVYASAERLGVQTGLTKKSDGWVDAKVQSPGLHVAPLDTDDSRMPSVVGMGLKDALYLLEDIGLEVAFKGKGTVSGQSVEPGTPVSSGQSVTLTLRPVEEKLQVAQVRR